tara:strand:+ start:47045 stop:47857 length:813 start_codon:yes stop_codon:yes gene_type:complete
MKVISFNINSVRARPHQVQAIIDKHNPDIIGLQETKVVDEEFPHEVINEMGYMPHIHGQKGHYGVAILTKESPLSITKGFDKDTEESQKRFISIKIKINNEELHILNGYFPQGESREHPIKFPAKIKFYKDLSKHLKKYHNSSENLILMGDLNISPEDIDIGIGEENKKRWLRTGKCSFLPEEREMLANLTSWGLKDTFRSLNPDVNDKFSWFDYRSRGFEDTPKRGLRIDQIWATESLTHKLKDSGIDYDIRGLEKPSDHAPIWSYFKV